MGDKVKAATHHPGDKPAEIGTPTKVGDGLDDTRKEISTRPVGKVGGVTPVAKTDTDVQKVLDGELPKNVFAGTEPKTEPKTYRGPTPEQMEKAFKDLFRKDQPTFTLSKDIGDALHHKNVAETEEKTEQKTFQKTGRGPTEEQMQKAFKDLSRKDRRHLTEDYRGVD